MQYMIGDIDIEALDNKGGYYARHVHAMTAEGLTSKSDIAAELAYRDFVIDVLIKMLDSPVGTCNHDGSIKEETLCTKAK